MKNVFAKVTNVARMGLGLALVLGAIAATAQADPPFDTPEIDPGSIGSAMTLLLGGAMLLKGRLRKKS